MEEEIKRVFENDNFLVLEKPAGMVTTKEGRDIDTVEDYLRLVLSNDLPRNGIIHRLDKGTSGLVMVTKTNEAFLGLKKQFKERSLTKKYYCLVGGDVSFEGTIDMPIARSKYAFARFGVNVDGKNALTKFRLVKKYKNEGKIYSLLEVDLKTGRTHQIRVHFSHLRWPLVGDKVYGGEKIDGLNRPFLHAYKIIFRHPINGQEIKLEAELPNDLKEVLKKYEEY
jgi:23S rRNA pseudouridine1911/1915/1917 synthase